MDLLKKLGIVLLGLLCLCSCSLASFANEKCIKLYRDGGALAAAESRHCPEWNHIYRRPPYNDPDAKNCSEAAFPAIGGLFGDHHTFCDLELDLPYNGSDGVVKDAITGIVAVFNGYNNTDDIEWAWKYLTDFYYLNMCFLKDAAHSQSWNEVLPDSRDNSHVEILKGALIRAIYDTTSFIKEQLFATVMLLIDDQMFMTIPGGSSVLVDETSRRGGRLPASLSRSDEYFTRIKNVELVSLEMEAKDMISLGSEVNRNGNFRVSAYIQRRQNRIKNAIA